jgi:1-acyl-sn-glycerol-3-phosphate acyltransferase
VTSRGCWQTTIEACARPRIAELLAPDETWGARLRRRGCSIGLELIVFALLTALSPVLALCALVIDMARWLRRRTAWMTLRLLALLWWSLLIELVGLVRLSRLRLAAAGRDPAAFRAQTYRLRRWWLCSHLAGFRRIFGIAFKVDGLDVAGPGPVVILVRHASTVDTLLPEGIIAPVHGLGLRYVLKRELLALPTIDIGRRLAPTVFVRRSSADAVGAFERLATLATDLGRDEGILIYPEGTLFNPRKLAKAQRVIAARQPELAERAARLRHVLPPRPGGTLALLRAAPSADVVVCGHFGLPKFEYLSDAFEGELVGSTVHVKFWRYPASAVPMDSEDSFRDWLYDRWYEMDRWIDSELGDSDQSPAAAAAA